VVGVLLIETLIDSWRFQFCWAVADRDDLLTAHFAVAIGKSSF
jgi:hypothetical protein